MNGGWPQERWENSSIATDVTMGLHFPSPIIENLGRHAPDRFSEHPRIWRLDLK